jgi:hypothetical protein
MEGLQEVFGAREEDICWVTPVRDQHFSYHSSVLAGRFWHGKGPLGVRAHRYRTVHDVGPDLHRCLQVVQFGSLVLPCAIAAC